MMRILGLGELFETLLSVRDVAVMAISMLEQAYASPLLAFSMYLLRRVIVQPDSLCANLHSVGVLHLIVAVAVPASVQRNSSGVFTLIDKWLI